MHLSYLAIFSAITVSSVLTAGERLPDSGYPSPSWLPWLAGIALDCDVLVSHLEAKCSLSCLDLGERGKEKPSRQGCWKAREPASEAISVVRNADAPPQ